jgi:hypothetical protein
MAAMPLKSPGNRRFDRFVHPIPTDVKRRGHLFPRHPPGPAGQKPAVLRGQRALAFGPGNLFHLDAAGGTAHAAHVVEEPNPQAPQRDELEPPCGQTVVAGTLLPATRANRPTVGAGFDLHLQSQLRGVFQPADFSIHKRLVRGHAIEDSFKLHPGSPGKRRSLVTPS